MYMQIGKINIFRLCDPLRRAIARQCIEQICIYTHNNNLKTVMKEIIIKSLDPLRAKKTFIRKKLGHTMVSAIKASSVTL